MGGGDEKRTDTYFNLFDKQYGLKFRGSQVLELKVLKQIDPHTKAELWEKSVRTSYQYHPKVHNASTNWKKEVGAMITGCKEVVNLLKDFHFSNLIPIEKSRQQTFVNMKEGSCIAGIEDILMNYMIVLIRVQNK